MIENSNVRVNVINKFYSYIKEKYKFVLGFIIAIFLIFVIYQYYSFYLKNNILKNSISYFNSNELEPNEDYFELIKKLSENKDFYSIISSFEIINIYIKDKRYDEANELYFELLKQKDLDKIYKAAIAAHASYNNLNVIFETSNLKLKGNIDEFIKNIDDDLEAYKGIKLEIKYLLSVSEQDINNISPKNDVKTNELYNLIQEAENVSSKIKERVKKIHEFQIYK